MVRRFSRSGVACGAKDAGTFCAAGMAVSVFGTSSPRTSSSSVTPKSSESFKSLSSSGIEASVSHLDTLWREMSNASARSPCDQFFCVRRRTMFSPNVQNTYNKSPGVLCYTRAYYHCLQPLSLSPKEPIEPAPLIRSCLLLRYAGRYTIFAIGKLLLNCPSMEGLRRTRGFLRCQQCSAALSQPCV